MKTSGHKVLITGGGSGIGRALAEKFYQAGNEVVIIGRDRIKLEQAAASMPGIIWRVSDVTNAAHRAQLVVDFPDITVLVNNAGIQRNGEFLSMTTEQIESEIDIDFRAPILLSHAFLPYLLNQQEAAIVNISSALAFVPKPNASIYCASKAALHSFSQSLRHQLKATHVKIFDVLPALIDTEMTAARKSSKLSPAKLADQFWSSYRSNRFEICIGKTKVLKAISRLAPAVAEHIVLSGQ
jgi:uncharacterized oxidoreductase